MMLTGLSGVPGSGEGLQKEVQAAPRETLRVLACCQALIQVDGELVGDPLEKAAFLAAGNFSLCLLEGPKMQVVQLLCKLLEHLS